MQASNRNQDSTNWDTLQRRFTALGERTANPQCRGLKVIDVEDCTLRKEWLREGKVVVESRRPICAGAVATQSGSRLLNSSSKGKVPRRVARDLEFAEE
jgi:hypothetical protein